MMYALAFIPAVGLPIVAFLNSWLTCFKKDAAHLPFYRRVTPAGYSLLCAVVILASFNLFFLYQGQTRAGLRADRLEKQLADAQSALELLQAETVRAFADDLSVRSWYQRVSIALKAVYFQQQGEAMTLGQHAPGLKAGESVIRRLGNLEERPSWIRDIHEKFYASRKKSTNLINRAIEDYVPVLRQAGIEEANLQKLLADWPRRPDDPPELERSYHKVGFDPDLAQAYEESTSRELDLTHEVVQTMIEVEHARRLALIRPPANPLSRS